MNFQKPNILIAFKALTIVSGLSITDRRVAGAILDHYNRINGQCDPSLETIAALLGVHRRTVIRSINRLERNGFFKRTRHGGKFHRNFYAPCWARFLEFENEWTRRRFERSRKWRRERLSPWQGQKSHLSSGTDVTQTYPINLSNETLPDDSPRAEPTRAIRASGPRPGNGEKQPSKQIGTRFKIKHIRSRDAALAAAERRWCDDLHKQFSHDEVQYGKIIEAIDASIQLAATDAELYRHGAGLKLVLDRLGILT